jgi:uncharacterized lipoprotein YddW (UPF0748 family)
VAARPLRQLRGLWITTVNNIDWPKPAGLSADEQKKQYSGLLDAAQSHGINAVFVQIRPQADSLYPGAPEPWSKWLTGTSGRDPGYDALGFCLAQAQRRNLEFHPGVPEARRFVEHAIMDVVHKYDIDGVHFDDYFYPYPVPNEFFPDHETFARYGAGFSDLGDWRRSNINCFVHEVSQQVAATKPWVRFVISPFGIWRYRTIDPTGSDTTGFQGYDGIYADTRLWVQNGWLDYIAPQLYWKMDDSKAAYTHLLPWWAKAAAGTGTALYIGQAAYRLNPTAADPVWRDPTELLTHMGYNRSYPQGSGDIWFDTTHFLTSSPNLSEARAANLYRRPALVPASARIPGFAPPPPCHIHADASTGKCHSLGLAPRVR